MLNYSEKQVTKPKLNQNCGSVSTKLKPNPNHGFWENGAETKPYYKTLKPQTTTQYLVAYFVFSVCKQRHRAGSHTGEIYVLALFLLNFTLPYFA
jgi:hypothetical protein